MTANVITYRGRSAIREVGKALGFTPDQVDRLAKLLSPFEFRDAHDDVSHQLHGAGLDPAAPRVRLLVDLVRRIQGLPRHLGQHAGGLIMASGRLDDIVPLEPAAMPGRVVVQWDKDDCADLGLIKIDLLALGMMAVLEDAIPLVREADGGLVREDQIGWKEEVLERIGWLGGGGRSEPQGARQQQESGSHRVSPLSTFPHPADKDSRRP
jgi:error-prone DNA polymerase